MQGDRQKVYRDIRQAMRSIENEQRAHMLSALPAFVQKIQKNSMLSTHPLEMDTLCAGDLKSHATGTEMEPIDPEQAEQNRDGKRKNP
jgi:hypothetical protein